MSTEDAGRKEFETSPRFKGMDFSRSPIHPEYYNSPYANGAWDGWQASREALVVTLPTLKNSSSYYDGGDVHDGAVNACRKAIEAAGLRVTP